MRSSAFLELLLDHSGTQLESCNNSIAHTGGQYAQYSFRLKPNIQPLFELQMINDMALIETIKWHLGSQLLRMVYWI